MKEIKSEKISKLIGIIFLTLGAGVLVWTAALYNAQDIWFDELFTVELSAKPLAKLLSLAAGDVHPPLYYIYIRIVFLLLKGTGLSIVSVAKIAACIPYLFIMMYAAGYIRHRFGWISAGLMVFLIETMPQLSQYMMECRMYSIALFTVMAMFIHGIEAVRPGGEGDNVSAKSRYTNLVVAVIYGIASMYLHYYAFIGAAMVATCMLVCVIINQKKKAENVIKIWMIFMSCVVCLVAYLPWVRIVLGQVGAVKQSYWIQPVSWRTFPGCIKYIFKPEFENGMVNYLVVAVLVLVYVGLFILFCMKHRTCDLADNLWKKEYIIATLAVPVLLVIVACVTSIIIKPIFVYRYMIPVLGIFWMGYSCLLGWNIELAVETFTHRIFDQNKDRKLGIQNVIIICISLIMLFTIPAVAVRDYNMFKWEEQKKQSGMVSTMEVFHMIGQKYSDATLVCNFNQVQAVLWYYLDNPSMLWGETDELLVAQVCGRNPLIMTDDTEKMVDYIQVQESKVDGEEGFIFVGSGNARDEIIGLWESQGMTVTEIADSCLVERYYFNLYKVEINAKEDN